MSNDNEQSTNKVRINIKKFENSARYPFKSYLQSDEQHVTVI